MILVTGATGSLGQNLVHTLNNVYGELNVFGIYGKKEHSVDFDKLVIGNYYEIDYDNPDLWKLLQHRKRSGVPDDQLYLINNAGAFPFENGTSLQESLDTVYRINMRLPAILSEQVLQFCINNNFEMTIINIASMSHRIAMSKNIMYSASKAFLVQMTKSMAKYISGIEAINGRVYCISPNMLDKSTMVNSTLEKYPKTHNTVYGTFQDMNEVTSLVNYLMVHRPLFSSGDNFQFSGTT